MPNPTSTPPVQRKKSRYRMVIMNEDSFEEVTQFRLTRLTVYLGISTFFVAMITLTVSLILFTPIKYYLPGAGFGNLKQMHELKTLKLKTDSLTAVIVKQQAFQEQIMHVLKGEIKTTDTTRLKIESPTPTKEKKTDKDNDKKRKKK